MMSSRRSELSVEPAAGASAMPGTGPADLGDELLLDLYRSMVLIRRFEEKIIEAYGVQDMKTPVHLCIGQEAVAAGVCSLLGTDDYLFTTHRGHGHCLAKGMDPGRLYAEFYGRASGCCGGRGGSVHPADPARGILGTTAMVGGGIPPAVGTALASAMRADGRVSAAIFGDGAADEGTFHESLNFAALKKLPVIFVCENNFYATASPQRARQAELNIARRAGGYGMPGVRIDGNDVQAVYRAAEQAIGRARAGEGPTLIEARTYRWRGHVGPETDWQKGVRPREELDEWMKHCPVKACAQRLIDRGVLDRDDCDRIVDRIDRRLDEAMAFAKASAFPDAAEVTTKVFRSPTGQRVQEMPRAEVPVDDGARRLTVREALREAQEQLLASDERVFLIGEGVDDAGGIFGTTLGLADRFGPERVLDIPIAENGMTGVAAGAAMAGMRPIFAHMRMDFLPMCMDQLVNHAAKWHYMTAGQVSVPLVVRAIIGRGWGAAAQHSQALHGLFLHVPGLKIAIPSTPYDAKGLLIAACRQEDPVLFVEHRWTFDQVGYVPEEMYAVPFGQGAIRRAGRDVTIVAISQMVGEAVRAADALEREGIDAEVLDPRTLNPLDEELILESVRKTGCLVIADPACRTGGAGGEIACRVVEADPKCLKAPVRRVNFPDAPTPCSPALEEAYYPGAEEIAAAVRELVEASP